MYRVGLEAILGFTKRGDTLIIDPCVPSGWPGYEIAYRHGKTTYAIKVEDPAGVMREGASVMLDGRLLDPPAVVLVDDGVRHEVLIRPRAYSQR